VPTAAGLSDTDAFLNIQQTGETFFASGVAVPSSIASGQRLAFSGPLSFTVDLHGVAAGTLATLSFDLLGFGPRTSIVMVDEVALSGALPPTLSLALDPVSDTGVLGDGITSATAVTLAGTTDPLQEVRLDVDGDGSDDMSTAADTAGLFHFANVRLKEGINNVRGSAADDLGATTVARTVARDSQDPAGDLAGALAGSVTDADLGCVAVRWQDAGGAGLDERTFGVDDIRIPGVTLDHID